ncbi:MAG: DUF89 family protein [Anaerolineae bacterium]|nr:DUF89 family protein [Anaerolineae bacterium]
MSEQIRTDSSNAFAHDTMQRRFPATVREVASLNPDYPPAILNNLARLAETIEQNQTIAAFDPLAPDIDLWTEPLRRHEGHTWLNTDWFFAEIAGYRHLISAVRWWETGRDPFAPKKAAELGNAELWRLLAKALELRRHPLPERLAALIYMDLWGNRIDLSFAPSLEHGTISSESDLLVDDAHAVVSHLLEHKGDIHFIADNTGTELALDLALADALLDHGVTRVVFHLKIHPTFVSDATVSDMYILLAAMASEEYGDEIAQLARRLRAALDTGRLRLAPDFFWNSSYALADLPARLKALFAPAALVINKGDLNYRRLLGDVLWPATTPFAQVTAHFPAPLLALRTLKSDPIVGLPHGLAEHLDAQDHRWRVNGRRGVLQFRKG